MLQFELVLVVLLELFVSDATDSTSLAANKTSNTSLNNLNNNSVRFWESIAQLKVSYVRAFYDMEQQEKLKLCLQVF